MTPSPEWSIVSARAAGELSADAAFEALHALYAATVLVWLRMEAGAGDADDLCQDVWTIFHRRWRQWDFRPEMQTPEARPVISFLYRTARNVLRAHRRVSRSPLPLDPALPAPADRDDVLRQLDAVRLLNRVRAICPPRERRILLAKLAGVPAREIACTLQTTEAVVDHAFRGALARVRRDLEGRIDAAREVGS